MSAALTMCRGKQNKTKKIRSKCQNYEGPILNKDRVHASPTFILSSEKVDRLLARLNTDRVRDRYCDNMSVG